LTRCLIAAELIANLAEGTLSVAKSDAARMVLSLDGIDGDGLERIIARVQHAAAALSAVLTAGWGDDVHRPRPRGAGRRGPRAHPVGPRRRRPPRRGGGAAAGARR